MTRIGLAYVKGSVPGFDDLKNKTDKNFLLTGSSTLAVETDNKQNKYIAPNSLSNTRKLWENDGAS